MDPITYATIRQRELLMEAERRRPARLLALVRRCREQDSPSTVRLLVEAVRGRPAEPMSC